jgi:hypothetical protein
MGDEIGGGYSSPPPCLIDLTTTLDKQQDDAEIQLFKVSKRAAAAAWSLARNADAQAMLSDLFRPPKGQGGGHWQDGEAYAPPPPLRLPDSVARSIEQMCSQTFA